MTTYPDPGAIANVVGTSGRIEASWGNAVRDRLVNRFPNTTARDAAITTPTEGMMCVSNADNAVFIYTGAGWEIFCYYGAQPTHSATVVQTGTVSYGGGSTLYKYNRHGREVTCFVNLVITGSGTAASIVKVSLPFTAAAAETISGGGFIFDSDQNTVHPGIVTGVDTLNFGFYPAAVTSTAGGFLGTTGFTAGLAANDVIRANFTYEAAS